MRSKRIIFIIIILILVIAYFVKRSFGEELIKPDPNFEVFKVLESNPVLPGAIFESVSKHHCFVKFENDDFAAQRSRIQSFRFKVIEYLHPNTYLVKSDLNVDNFQKTEDAGFEIIPFLPIHKIEPALFDLINGKVRSKQASYDLLVILFEGSDRSVIEREVSKIDGISIKDELHPDNERLVIKSPSGLVENTILRLTALEEVMRIEKMRYKKVSNDESSWMCQSGIYGKKPIWDHGITGAGQIIAVSDTGLDIDHCFYWDPFYGMPAFLDNFYDPDHRKVIGYFVWTREGNDWDKQGHGTHTAGSAAGDDWENMGKYDTDDGLAFNAKLIMQDLGWGNVITLSGTPSNLEYLLYEAYDAGARIHSNSWGSEENVYSSHARDVDNFLFDNQDMVVLFSNGNSGSGSGTVTEPATAKNCISVGATYKQSFSSYKGIAYFSSRGPTSDGRIKPDLVAPGVYVNSAFSDKDKNTFNCNRIPNSGTSMSCPVAAGLAALVRQYYADGFYPSGKAMELTAFSPSGALVKGTLINSCGEIEGYNSKPPNNSIGWGLPVLEEVLYFEGDARKLLIFDETEGLNDGETFTYRFANASSNMPLKITLTWYDPRASSSASKKLVNNIDMKITSPDGTIYSGNNFADGYTLPGAYSDDTNNIEGILINDPDSGTYNIELNGTSIATGPQSFAVVITGDLVGRRGDICFDKDAYQCIDNITIRLVDGDLAGSGSLNVKVESERAKDSETISLIEMQPSTGIFTSVITIDIVSENNPVILVEELDKIIVTYVDEDDGMGGNDVETKCSVDVDCIAPVISGVSIHDAGHDYITINWMTDEETVGEVIYKLPGSPEMKYFDNVYTTSHAVRLDNLKKCSEYEVSITSSDRSGNRSLDDNNGSFYKFNTLSELFVRSAMYMTPEGNWKLSDRFSRDGQDAWSSGYGANQCNRLFTNYFYISPDQPTYMTFWTIYDIEAGYDGGIVEVAVDYADEWEIIEPLYSGYPVISRDDTTSCIGQSVPCFSGKNDLAVMEWEKYIFDLTKYAGKAIAISFLFASDPAEEGNGWFIDDLQVFRNYSCISVENNTDEPKIECEMDKKVYEQGDYMESILYFDNPLDENLDLDVYCALISVSNIFFFNGHNFVVDPEGFRKTLTGSSEEIESIFVLPILNDALKGEYIFASVLAKSGTYEIYGEISTFPFSIE